MTAPGTPLLGPKQALSIAQAQARINIWEGAIRSSKTVGSLAAWIMHVVTMRDRQGEVFVFGRTRDAIARNVFAPLQTMPLLRAMAPGTHYVPGAPTGTIFGQTVHVLGASDRQAEEKLRGMTGKSAYGDELTVLPAPFFRQALGRLSVRGAKLFGTTNPDNPAHWLRRDYLLRADELDLATWHFTLDDNPFLDPAYVAAIKTEYTGLWYRRMIEGAWVQAEGAIYESFDPDRHVVDELPALDRVLCAGVDYGSTNPFHAVLLAITRDGRLAVTREYRHDPRIARRGLTDAEFSTALRDWLALDQQHPQWVVVDPSAESFHLQLHRDGVRGVIDADNAVGDGIRLVASLFATGRLIIHRSCRGLLDEVPGYAWDDKAAEKGEDRPIKAADHGLDALRYAVATTQAAWRRAVPLHRFELALAA